MADIVLSKAVRSNLLSLQRTSSLIDRTQNRFSTGLAVGSPVDDPVKFFQSKSLGDRANTLNERKSAIDKGLNTLDVALKAMDTLEGLMGQMKGIIDSARSGDKAQRKGYEKQLEELVSQMEQLVGDASYLGVKMLNSEKTKLSVRFSDRAESKLDVEGINFNRSMLFRNSEGAQLAAGPGGDPANTGEVVKAILGFADALDTFEFSVAEKVASFNEQADTATARLEATISNLQSEASQFANSVAILRARRDFTETYVVTLEDGVSQLTTADLNEEGANLMSLQVRQQLATQSLGFARQSQQGVLALFN